ncbi:MAG: DNA-binding protein WhiA [Oscillospiraceae bacterium]|nr:DNA-binding protein WhiA [Oscillospiraceae bacterium]
MSFSSDVKNEICRKAPENPKYVLAEIYGFIRCCKQEESGELALYTENKQVAARLAEDLLYCFGIIAQVSTRYAAKHKRAHFTASLTSTEDEKRLTKLINSFKVESDGGAAAMLRGAFLASGTLTDPNKEYHLEFSTQSEAQSEYLCEKLAALGIGAKAAIRQNQRIVYVKGREQIADFLGHIGAIQAYLAYTDVVIEKDMRNDANRQTNCDSANISKTVKAAGEQIAAIEKIKAANGSLPEELREIAQIRLENPELSLREIGELLTPSLSRSGVNHRIKRLMELAAGL